MEMRSDFRELLALLNDHEVEYVIVGAHALAFHGAPRYTGDIDVYVRPTNENAKRVMCVMQEFGFGEIGLTENDFSKADHVVQLGYEPVRIDIMTSISGVEWDEVDQHAVHGFYGDLPVRFIGRKQFIATKRASGRKKDAGDIEALGEK